MADTKSKPKDGFVIDLTNLTENVFTAVMAYTFEFALIYFLAAIMMLSMLFTEVWSIQAVGILAILHLIGIPIGYYGVKIANRLMVLLSLILCCIWFILIIVYLVVFFFHKREWNDFEYRSLHQAVLAMYAMLDLFVIVMLSIDIISEKSRNLLRKSLNESPTEAASPPAPTTMAKPPNTSDDKMKKK